MNGTIFLKTLYDERKRVLVWGLFIAVMGGMTVMLYPTIKSVGGFEDIIKALPPAIKAMAGDVEDFDTLEGWLATKFFAFGPIMLAVYAVQFGAASVAGEERRGTMDLLMSVPISRRRVIVEKFAALIVSLLVISIIGFMGIVLTIAITPEAADASLGNIFAAMLNLLPIALTFGATTFLFSATLSSRRSSGQIVAGMVGAFYILNLLGRMSSSVEPLRIVNPFYYYGSRTLFDGMNWGNVGVLLLLSALLMAATVYSFTQRDLTV